MIRAGLGAARCRHASRTHLINCRTQNALRQRPGTALQVPPPPEALIYVKGVGRSAGGASSSSGSDAELMHRRSFYQRKLPEQLLGFSSPEGRKRFLESATSGQAEAYFPLAEQFITQIEPAFCGPSCLAMVLNTLRIDPNAIWKGGWRWFDERTLARSCCKPIELIEKEGITLDEFAAIGRCHGAIVDVYRPSNTDDAAATGVRLFRETLLHACSSAGAPYLIVSFLRTALGQTGTGHFSPVAAYHKPSDSCLVLDIARFKLPPYWVPVADLFAAMLPIDSDTGQPRGYALVSGASAPQAPGTERSMAQLGGGGGRCALSAIKREFCPVGPRLRAAASDGDGGRGVSN
mmetsp:Transcript_2273/g.5158  ORF Transcript_2273/g.5158 Transcript_2273/m.5158 type:complete len:349 (-) Transcript_2273:172-1218(-)